MFYFLQNLCWGFVWGFLAWGFLLGGLCLGVFVLIPGTICNDQRSSLYTAGGLGGVVSPPAGPGQSAGGGEAPGSSEKLPYPNRPKNTCVFYYFSVLNTVLKSCQIQLTR